MAVIVCFPQWSGTCRQGESNSVERSSYAIADPCVPSFVLIKCRSRKRSFPPIRVKIYPYGLAEVALALEEMPGDAGSGAGLRQTSTGSSSNDSAGRRYSHPISTRS